MSFTPFLYSLGSLLQQLDMSLVRSPDWFKHFFKQLRNVTICLASLVKHILPKNYTAVTLMFPDRVTRLSTDGSDIRSHPGAEGYVFEPAVPPPARAARECVAD